MDTITRQHLAAQIESLCEKIDDGKREVFKITRDGSEAVQAAERGFDAAIARGDYNCKSKLHLLSVLSTVRSELTEIREILEAGPIPEEELHAEAEAAPSTLKGAWIRCADALPLHMQLVETKIDDAFGIRLVRNLRRCNLEWRTEGGRQCYTPTHWRPIQ
jgi:hypothetical protein